MPNDDLRAVLTAPLHEVPWLHIGRTEEYADLKAFIALVCHDVTHAACIDELCINDVVQAFLKHGYVVVPASALERLEAAERAALDAEAFLDTTPRLMNDGFSIMVSVGFVQRVAALARDDKS